jgi:hypothetical protein
MEMKAKEALGVTFQGSVTFNGPMFDIHDNQHVHIERSSLESVQEKADQSDVKQAEQSDEELFHFIHPEIEGEEAWRNHHAIKRLVANYRVPEICTYLKEQKQKGKLLLPLNPSSLYTELVRLGMPNGDGFSEKNFSNVYNSYMK